MIKLFKKRVYRVSVKEAFDNLPAGLCFFNKNGIPKLCNRTMHRLAYELTGRDLQHISQLACVLEANESSSGVCTLPSGSMWRFSSRNVEDSSGNTYTEYAAFDVTELCAKRTELERDNERLREMSAQLHKLSESIATATREEEILALKMRVHDRMGRSLVAAHKFLVQNQPMDKVGKIISEWQCAVSLLQKAGDEPQTTDMLEELRKASEGMINIIVTGSLPEQTDCAYLVVTAIRVCLTNAVRHAHATELYASISETGVSTVVCITNNGVVPKGEITEGGGLSALRKRIECFGGTMSVKSTPCFELTVGLPTEKE